MPFNKWKIIIIRNNTKAQPNGVGDLADDAFALLEATVHVTGQKVQRARKRLEVALKRGKAAGEDLMEDSAELGSDNIKQLRERITVALDHGKEIYDDVHDDVARRTKAADHTVRENPYQVMGIALGVGAIVGFIVSFRRSRH